MTLSADHLKYTITRETALDEFGGPIPEYYVIRAARNFVAVGPNGNTQEIAKGTKGGAIQAEPRSEADTDGILSHSDTCWIAEGALVDRTSCVGGAAYVALGATVKDDSVISGSTVLTPGCYVSGSFLQNVVIVGVGVKPSVRVEIIDSTFIGDSADHVLRLVAHDSDFSQIHECNGSGSGEIPLPKAQKGTIWGSMPVRPAASAAVARKSAAP